MAGGIEGEVERGREGGGRKRRGRGKERQGRVEVERGAGEGGGGKRGGRSGHPLSVCGVFAVHHQPPSIGNGHQMNLTLKSLPWSECVQIMTLPHGV